MGESAIDQALSEGSAQPDTSETWQASLAIVIGSLTSRSGFPLGRGDVQPNKYPKSVLASVEQDLFENDLTLLPDVGGVPHSGKGMQGRTKQIHVFAGDQAAARGALSSGAKGMGAVHFCGSASLDYLCCEQGDEDKLRPTEDSGNFGGGCRSAFEALYGAEHAGLERAARILHLASLIRVHTKLARRSLYRGVESAVIAVPREIMQWEQSDLGLVLYGSELSQACFVDRTFAGYLGCEQSDNNQKGSIEWDTAVASQGRAQPLVDLDGATTCLRFVRPLTTNGRQSPQFFDSVPERSRPPGTESAKGWMLSKDRKVQSCSMSPSLAVRLASGKESQQAFDADRGEMIPIAASIGEGTDASWHEGLRRILSCKGPRRGGEQDEDFPPIHERLGAVERLIAVGDGCSWQEKEWSKFVHDWNDVVENDYTDPKGYFVLPRANDYDRIGSIIRGTSLLCDDDLGAGIPVLEATKPDQDASLWSLLKALRKGTVQFARPRKQVLRK